jgi:hypothetical protein
MNFKTFTLLLLISSLFLNIEAKTVNLSDAEKVAKNFIFVTSNKYDDGFAYDKIRLSAPYTHSINGSPVFYAFQLDPGFVIISAEDAFMPVVGYSYEGKFIFDEAPAHYKGFILNYAEQISYVRENQLEPAPEVTAAWSELRNFDIASPSVTRERDVDPLLDCNWNQGSPYNIFCPADANGPGGHVYVGCVATAMAQIMYYWRYPETGTGQHCYTPGNSSYGQQCANFGQTSYDWSGMINSIDSRNPDPNALLQYHCAVSVNMSFGPNGSGSQSYLVPGRLNQYFRYNSAQYKEKSDYSQAGWISLLKADIDAGKPLYYSGYNTNWEGHAFVCDGYQGDNFHFNFGWSGSGNGYYSLYDVNSFSIGQACVRNFAPSDVNYPYYSTGTKNISSRSGSITDGSGPVANYMDNTTAYWLIDPQTIYDSITSVTLSFKSFDLLPGDSVRIYDGNTTASALMGAYSGTNLPPALTSSSNSMLVEFITDGSGNASGFYAEYNSTSPSWCQGLTQLTEPSGTFDDGSGNFYYQSSATCMWRIKPAFANKITLNFNYFETEAGIDKVTVYDGTSLIAEFSGTEIPGPVVANSGSMFITWSTNVANNFQGWEAFYEVDNVGVDEKSVLTNLEVYPNPATEVIHIRLRIEEKSNLKIRLVNLTGQTVYSEEQLSFQGAYQHDIAVSSLPAGFYFLKIGTLTGTFNKKIMIR